MSEARGDEQRDQAEGDGFRPRYPWEQWLDGQRHELRRGREFHCAPSALRRMALRAAMTRGQVLRTRIDGDTVILQTLGQAAGRDG